MGFFSRIFGGGSRGKNYKNLESYLRGKVRPSADEAQVRAQLEKTLSELPESKKSAFSAYISGESWKKTFLKK